LNYSLLSRNFQSTSFHGKIRIAKQAGRRFKFFDILAGIRSDYRVPTHELEQLRFDVEKDKWDRPRHSVEDAFKTMFGEFSHFNYLLLLFLGALSDNLWNVNTVSRNRNNDTYEWPTEKRLLFGFYIFRRQWQTIADGLADNGGII
jgi:hypothetical protein